MISRKMHRFLALAGVAALVLASAAGAVDPEPKDATPHNVSFPPLSLTGGPDAYGYSFADSNEPGCAFDFVDISATGTMVVDGDDNASIWEAMAPIDYYGVVYNDVIMGSNGYLTLSMDPTCRGASNHGGDLSNDCPIPDDPSTPSACDFAAGRIYANHDDLDLESGIGRGLMEYFASCPRDNPDCPGEDCTVFMWDDVAHYPGGASATTWDQEIIIYHQSGDIVFQIGAGNPEQGSSSTTGNMNEPQNDGLMYACNAPGSLADNTAVCYSHPFPDASCSTGGGGGGGGGGGNGGGGGASSVLLCHVPPGNPDNAHIISIGEPAVPAHMANHGDCDAPAGAARGDACSCGR